MSRFLFVMWEGGGTVPPELGIARRLLARGHDVDVIGDPTIERGARLIGAGFTSWRSAPHVGSLKPDDALVRDWDIKNPLALFRAMRDALICGPTETFARETLAAIEAHQPHVVVADMVMIGGLIAAEKAGLPSAVLVPNLYPFPSKGRPMIGTGMMPARGLSGRVRDALLGRVFTSLFDSGLPPVNEARAAFGLPPLTHTFDQQGRANVVLVLSHEAFDFQGPPFPTNVRFVGAQLDDPAWAESWTMPWPGGDIRPLVVVGFSSTFQDQSAALQRVCDALAQLPVRGVVTTGPALVGTALSVAANVHLCTAVPHGQVMPHAAVVVSHCGHGTTLKALSFGIPMLCLPMGRDQVDNAARVVWHGAGLRLKPTASAGQIGSALERLLNDGRYRTAARALAERMATGGEPARAVEAIEALAAGRATFETAG